MHSELLGFDIRLTPKVYVNQLWDHERRTRYLLRPEIKWPLSVDQMAWPSFFRYNRYQMGPAYFQFDGMIDITPNSTRHLALELWPDLDKMKVYFLKQRSTQEKNGIQIAVLLVANESLFLDEYWSAVLDPALSLNNLPKEWLLLGYDVADRYMISGLTNCGYDDNEKILLQKRWGSLINEYGLIKTLDDAVSFKRVCNKRVQTHYPFYVYGLFQNPETRG